MSTLQVNTISESTSGSGVTVDGVLIKDSKLASGTGNILQTKTQFFDTHTSIADTTTFTDTGLTLAITPSATSSKILCMFYVTASGENNSYCAFKMFRDSTEIGSSTVTGTGLECFAGATFDNDDNSTYGVTTIPMIFLDSPSTTSSVTYKVQASPMRTSSDKTIYINRSYNLGDDNQFRAVSNVILMEVGG
tara:strand:+ start:20 stop:595 length:576 start_codon:yes stop_codon:yes gene_type:complete